MWRPRSLFFTLLSEHAALLREQNSLLREQIQALTGRPARTPYARGATPLPTYERQPLKRQYTAADVTYRQQTSEPPTREVAPASLTGAPSPVPSGTTTRDDT